MGKIRRKFDIQFKTQICLAIQSGTHKMIDICRDHQVQRSTVENWLKRHSAGALATGPFMRERELERENEKLKAKVGELTMTIDILKKWKTGKNSREAPVRPSSPPRI